MEYEVLLKDEQSNFEEITQKKISSEKEMRMLFETINSTRMPGYDLPEVDFSSFDLFFYTPGSLSTGGHSVDVAEILRSKDKILINLTAISPGPGDFATSVITSPFILIKFAKTDKPVELVVRSGNQ
jgi:hypothetical protein